MRLLFRSQVTVVEAQLYTLNNNNMLRIQVYNWFGCLEAQLYFEYNMLRIQVMYLP